MSGQTTEIKESKVARNTKKHCSGQRNVPVAPGQSKIAKYTKNLAILLWPEEGYCCQVQPSRLSLGLNKDISTRSFEVLDIAGSPGIF